jgi:hypothetical protein
LVRFVFALPKLMSSTESSFRAAKYCDI